MSDDYIPIIGLSPEKRLNTNKVTTDVGEVHNEVVEPYAHGSAGNTSTDPLGSGATFTGIGELSNTADVMVSCQTDNSGTLFFDFSVDGTNWGVFPVDGFSVASGIHEWHVAVKGPRYFRVRLINDSGAQSYLRLYTYFGVFRHGNLPLNQSIGDDSDAIVVRSVLVGETQGGIYKNVGVSSAGTLQLDLPRTGFGELSVAEKTPQVQLKWPNGIIPDNTQVLTNKSGSSVTATDGVITITVAGAAEAFSQFRSFEVVRYGSGQGMNTKFTAAFSTGLADSSLWSGPGDDDEMLAFGYNGTAFGILHRKFGELEVRSITFTQGGDAGGGTFTLTLDDTDVTITVGADDTITDVCALVVAASADIFNAGRGWEVHTADSKTVEFFSLVAENATGTFSFADVDSGVTAGTFQQDTTVLEGVPPTENVIAQANWNIDTMDGTGVSGMTLNPANLNIYDITLQYLGAGNLFFSVENPATGRFEPVHMMLHAGTETVATFRNPTFHMNMIAKTDAGFSGAAQTIKTASMAGFIEGKETHSGTRKSAKATVSTNGATGVCVLLLHNENNFNGTRNKVIAYPDHLTLINAATRNVIVRLIKNPTHIDVGATFVAVDAANSSMLSAGPGGTTQGGEELVDFAVSASDSKDIEIGHLGLDIKPTDEIAFVVTKGSGGQEGLVTVGASWLERI